LYCFYEGHVVEIGCDRLPRVGKSHHPLYSCRMGISRGDVSTRSEEAVIVRIISKTVGLIASDLTSSPVLAFEPRDLQRDIALIDAVLKSPSVKGATGTGEDRNCLIDVSLCFGGDKNSGKSAPMDGNVRREQFTATTCPMIWLNPVAGIFEAGIL
jgi:hypothetical protein